MSDILAYIIDFEESALTEDGDRLLIRLPTERDGEFAILPGALKKKVKPSVDGGKPVMYYDAQSVRRQGLCLWLPPDVTVELLQYAEDGAPERRTVSAEEFFNLNFSLLRAQQKARHEAAEAALALLPPRVTVRGNRNTIAAGYCHTVALKSDGTVVAAGANNYGQCNVSDWRDIVAISAGMSHTVGLRSDGTVVAVGDNSSGQCEVSDWRDIKLPPIGYARIVGALPTA